MTPQKQKIKLGQHEQFFVLRDSLTTIWYAFIGAAGWIKIFYTYFTLSIFKNIIIIMSNFLL
jgi:hypothetical protein